MEVPDRALQSCGVHLPRRPQALIDRALQPFECGLAKIGRARAFALAVGRLRLGSAALLVLVPEHALAVRQRLAPALVELLSGVISFPLLAELAVAADLHQFGILSE